MTTKPSIGKRLLGAMLAVPMALAGMGIGAMDQNINATQRLNGLFDAHAYRIIVANVHRKPGQPFRERFTLMTGASCYAKTVLYKQIGNG